MFVRGWLFAADAYGCQAPLDNEQELLKMCLEASREAGMTPFHHDAFAFSKEDWGEEDAGASILTLIVPLAESHLVLHTWSTRRFVAIDLFTCGDARAAEVALEHLLAKLQPKRTTRWTPVARGVFER